MASISPRMASAASVRASGCELALGGGQARAVLAPTPRETIVLGLYYRSPAERFRPCPRHVALCVALLVVRGGAMGRFAANHLLRSVRILCGIRGITRKSRPRFGRLSTQGRCATRLRYAPTLKNLDFTAVFCRSLPRILRFSGENCPRTVPELRPTVPEYPRFIILPVPKLPPTRLPRD